MKKPLRCFWGKVQELLHDRSACLRIVLYFLVVMVFFGNFMRTDYATDTYADMMLPARELIENFLRGGRLITLIFFIVFRGLHIPIWIVNTCSFVVAICALVVALYLLEGTIRRKLVHQKYWPSIIAFLIIVNPFMIELFLFIERGIMMLGVLACVVAAGCFSDYLDTRERKALLQTLGLVLMATFCYQGVVGLFIVLATLFLVLKVKTWRDFLKNTVISILLYVAGPLINIVFIKVFSSGGRTGGEIILRESMTKIIDGSKALFAMFDIVPGLFFWGVILAIVILWLGYCLYQRKIFQKLTLITLVQMVYLFLVSYLAAMAPQAIQNTASIWVVPRATYVFAAFLGIVLTVILSNYRQFAHKPSWNGLTSAFVGLFILGQFVGFNRIITGHYALNTIDRLRAEQISRLISVYESQNNITVTTIVPASDASLTYSYSGIYFRGDINVTAFATNWSDVTSINYWTQRSFVRQEADVEWQNYCASHNWDDFDMAELKFSGDTLKICWY